jgi:hypothetical protein
VVQRADGSCEVAVRAVAERHVDPEELSEALRALLGTGIPLRVREDPSLGARLSGGKVRPYRSEMDPGR